MLYSGTQQSISALLAVLELCQLIQITGRTCSLEKASQHSVHGDNTSHFMVTRHVGSEIALQLPHCNGTSSDAICPPDLELAMIWTLAPSALRS